MLYCSNMLAHGYRSHLSSSSTPKIWCFGCSSNFSPLPSEESFFSLSPHLSESLRRESKPAPKTKTKTKPSFLATT